VGASHRLHTERFAPPVARAPDAGREPAFTVILSRSGRSFAASSGTLLEQLERAGERPSFGCRMGICRTCRCRKLTGSVEDIRTGAVSSEPDEDIQPCISVPRSDVELGL
jgi:ferredoxin